MYLRLHSRSFPGFVLLLSFLGIVSVVCSRAEAQEQGACCLTAGCIETSANTCLNLSGSFLGPGVPCDPNPCSPICSLDPSVLDFGQITVGSSRERDFVVENTGYVRATGSFSESCDGFQIISSASYDLAPGERKAITVRFFPATPGGRECQVVGTECDGPLLVGIGTAAEPICVVTPTHLDFGSIGVGQFRDRAVTIRNAGGGLLAGSAAGCGPFTIVSGGSWELGAGEEQLLVVRFRPTGEGPVSCTLSTSVECEDVLLTGTGEPTPVCLVSPADLRFGEVVLGTPVDRTFTIENTGAGSLTGIVRLDCPGFVLVGASGYSLDAGESQDFTVRFLPQVEGEAECDINLGNACGVLPALGVGVRAPLCAYSPAFLDFGNVPLGSSRVDTFRVSNFGGAELAGTFVFDCPDFRILGDPSYMLAAGEAVTFEVEFTPSLLGGQVCRLSGDGCADFLLRAVGVEGPECVVSSTELDFGAVALGEVHSDSFRLGNEGGAVLSGTMTIVAEDPAASGYRFAATGDGNLAYSLSAGEAFDVVVELVAEVLGPAPARIVLVGSGAMCPDVSLRAEVEVPAECGLSIDTWDFGTVPLGESAETTVTITNTGGSRLVGAIDLDCDAFSFGVTGVTWTEVGGGGVSPADRGASGGPAPSRGSLSYDLGAGESQDVFIRFTPTREEEFSCELEFGALCGSVTLSGRGELPPACQLDMTEVAFGVVDLGEFADRSFVVTNGGGGRLVGEVTSPCPSFFFVGGNQYDLGPGESREILVRFVPDRSGPVSCVFDVGSSCAPVTATASGNGPICSVPAELRFGTVLPGVSRDLQLVIGNSGGGILRGSARSDCPSFLVLDPSNYELRSGEFAVIDVRFAPLGFGSISCEISLSGGCRAVVATGSGGEPPLCSLDIERLDFGPVALGSVVRQSFRIQNLGEGRLRGRVTENCAGFRLLGDPSYDLGSNQSRIFDVELTAFEEGVLACELDLGSDCRQLEAIADVRLPLGACCFADGSCAVTGEDTCTSSGGLVWYEEAACLNAGCVPIGACCAFDGSCSLTTETQCFDGSGIDWSEGVGCTTADCPPAGACCSLDGRCTLLVEESCDAEFLGVGTDCNPSPCVRLGACCFADGTCELRTESRCTPEGGVSWTLGAICEGVACEPVGACCQPSRDCVVTTASGCSGEYLGDATTCLPGECLEVGACCLPNEECIVQREDLCSGTFLGDEVICSPGVCLPKVEGVRVVRNGTEAEIEVLTPSGAVSGLEGWYRDAGTFTYRQVESFERRGDAWVSRFDSESSTVRGVEYYLSYVDEILGLRVLHGEAGRPHRLRLAGDAPVPWSRSGQFQMLSAPFTLDVAETVYDLFEERLGPTGSRSWKAGTWDPFEEQYIPLDREHPTGFEPGRAYWVILSSRPTETRLSGQTYFPPDQSYTFPIRLQPGWNMVGNPAAYPIRTDPSRSFIADRGEIFTLADAASGESPRISPLYAYDPEFDGPTEPYRVAPLQLGIWEGAWIENLTGHPITLLLPAVDALADDAPQPLATWLAPWGEIHGTGGTIAPSEGRSVTVDPLVGRGAYRELFEPQSFAFLQQIELRSGERHRILVLGAKAGAQNGLDGWDLADPPPAPVTNGQLRAALILGPSGTAERDRPLLRDVRAVGTESLWIVSVQSDEPIEFHFPDPIIGPGETSPALRARLDGQEGWRSVASLRTWILPAGVHRMEIWSPGGPVGDEGDGNPGDGGEGPGNGDGNGEGPGNGPGDGEVVLGSLDLRVEPHPIVGDATVLFRLPTPGLARIDCFDARGSRIWSYSSAGLDVGTHLIRWDGRAADGHQIQAGTYFLRLASPSGTVTRKVIVLPRD